ncbi:MAG: NAD-dependent epimerase/dehydratase family protein [Actinomycetota bacterium]
MNVLVTGGAGFIGANLCRHLSRSTGVDAVVALDDLSLGRRSNLDDVDARLIVGSILDPDALATAAEGADAIVHLAALGSVPRSIIDPLGSHEVNASGTLAVLEEARRRNDAHVVLASSSSVYGSIPTLPKHELLATRPLSPYGASKLAAESYALSYQESLGLPVLAFRFFNVYGPLQAADHVYAAVIPRFIDAAMNDRPLEIYGDGTQSRDFTYVDTVCSAITSALLDRVVHPAPVNLAFGEPHSLLEVVEELRHHFPDLTTEHADPRTGDIKHSDADCSVLNSLLPDVTPRPFVEGLAETVRWFRER